MTISNNVVSGNYSRDHGVSDVSRESVVLHDHEQPDRNQRRRDGAAIGEQGLRGLDLTSVENATILDNVISANQTRRGGSRGIDPGTESCEHERVPGKPDRHRQDRASLPLGNTTNAGLISSSRAASALRLGEQGPGQGNVIAFNSGEYGIYAARGAEQNQFTRELDLSGNAGLGISQGIGPTGCERIPDRAARTLTFTPGTGVAAACFRGPSLHQRT